MTKKIGLDDLYLMVSNIYSEQNYQRSESKTFSHFVEVCGMLTAPARGKKREVDFESALCNAHFAHRSKNSNTTYFQIGSNNHLHL